MTITALEPQKDNDTALDAKIQRPEDWKIVLHYGAPHAIYCCACLLREVFNISSSDANKHVRAAYAKGTDVVFQSSRDVVETKTADAESERKHRAVTCDRAMAQLKFTAEPI